MSIKKSFVFGIEIGSPLFLLLFIRPTVSGVLELAFQNCGCSHRRAPAVERTPSGKSKPRFVPQKDEVRLDSEALFHDPLDVIYVPVKSTARQHQEPRPLELSFGFQIEQTF